MNDFESKRKAIEALRSDKDWLFALADSLWMIPEGGFSERRTAAAVIFELEALGARVKKDLAITGFRAEIGDPAAPAVFLVADLDALITPGAGAGGTAAVMHSCGHYAQAAIMTAVFRAAVRAGLPEKEGFKLVFIGAPAEEYTDMEDRRQKRERGEIRFLSGKQEMIRLGVFDDALAVLKYHTMTNSPERRATVNGTLNGFIAKRAVFLGKAAHSGANPDKGVNALNAASIAQLAIHTQRETFRDQDHVRVHPIIREGGIAVNTVPDRVVLETYVRAGTVQAVVDASAKVDRALAAGAIAVGCSVTVTDLPGYLPLRGSSVIGDILGKNLREYIDQKDIDFADECTASDDIGDVSSLFPTCQLGFSGFTGTMHGSDLRCADKEAAYLLPAFALTATLADLGRDGAAEARRAAAVFKPTLTKAEYEALIERFFSERTFKWVPPEA
ncbi:MAG: peptidase dimerization domain-containing protein [Treponemataceae bacterium]